MKFEKIKNNFGFGLMRLPEKNGDIDYELVSKMVDSFIESGFNYFDTAHGYMGRKSEIAVRECLAKRHPRESFVLTNKLTGAFFNSEEEVYKIFNEQLEACGVEYFDFYLMHSQNSGNYPKFQRCHAYEVAQKLKQQGKIRHVGLSFHDKPELLDRILTDHPEIEAVQIQLNYVDYYDSGIQSKNCLDVCIKHGKPVIIMEPVKGGSLVNLPPEANEIFAALNGGSNASYAIRFAAGQQNVFMVLSGMSNLEQMIDNTCYMNHFKPLSDIELKAVADVCEIFKQKSLIPCTNCRYCVDGCPKNILIPDLFADLNAKTEHKDWNSDFYYHEVHTRNNGKASECIRCAKCESVCPQHLRIRDLLAKVKETFEK